MCDETPLLDEASSQGLDQRTSTPSTAPSPPPPDPTAIASLAREVAGLPPEAQEAALVDLTLLDPELGYAVAATVVELQPPHPYLQAARVDPRQRRSLLPGTAGGLAGPLESLGLLDAVDGANHLGAMGHAFGDELLTQLQDRIPPDQWQAFVDNLAAAGALSVVFPAPFTSGVVLGMLAELRQMTDLVGNLQAVVGLVQGVAALASAPDQVVFARAMAPPVAAALAGEVAALSQASIPYVAFRAGYFLGPLALEILLAVLTGGGATAKAATGVLDDAIRALPDFDTVSRALAQAADGPQPALAGVGDGGPVPTPEWALSVSDEAPSFGEATVTSAKAKSKEAPSSHDWPPNRGFDGPPTVQTLQPGTRIDRYGLEGGRFVSPEGTPFQSRSLPAEHQSKPYAVYEVVESIEVDSGLAAAWFGQPGGGVQYELQDSVGALVRSGKLKRIQQ